MNDLHIMQGLECCACVDSGCVCCPYICMLTDEKGCISTLAADALQLIKRLKKEASNTDNFLRNLCAERLLNGNKVATFEDLQSYINKQKTEAIKEFAEKLKKEKYCRLTEYDEGGWAAERLAVKFNDIDELAKEVTGGAEK